jgi:hypothetical protein
MNNIISKEYKGITYNITQEAIDDLKTYHDIDAIAEMERGIDLELKRLKIGVVIYNNTANLTVTKLH